MTEVQRLAKIMVLKDLLKEYELLAKYNGGTDYDRYCALEMAIKELEQEPKGHWIWCGGSHQCSNCEEYTCFSDKNIPKYCPNCGAKMESEGK